MLLAASTASAEGLSSLIRSTSARRLARPSPVSAATAVLGTRSAAFAALLGSRGPRNEDSLGSCHSGSSRRSSSRGVLSAGSPRSIARASMSSAAAADPVSTAGGAATLDTLRFDNRVIRELPVDPIADNYVRRVPNACFSVVAPDPVENPVLVSASSSALRLLGMGADQAERDDAALYFSGEFQRVFLGTQRGGGSLEGCALDSGSLAASRGSVSGALLVHVSTT